MSVFEALEYIYTPAPDMDASIHFYQTVVGGELLWKIRDGAAVVACLRLSSGPPLILLANHLKDGKPVMIYRVKDIDMTASCLKKHGCEFETGPFELPQGPCYIFRDPQQVKFAIYQLIRPGVEETFMGRFDE